MLAILRQLFGNLDVPLKRTRYAAWGFCLAVLKYCGDASLIHYATGRLWSPADYLTSLPLRQIVHHARPHFNITFALLLWLVPFVWIGVVYTMRRALDAGWSPWWALAFFVPYLNYFVMVMFCLLPSSGKYAVVRRDRDPIGRRFGESAALGLAAGVCLGLLMVGLVVILKGNYGYGLFIGTPVAMGMTTGYGMSRRSESTKFDLFLGALAVNFAVAAVLLVIAFEGAGCLLMALPIGVLLSFIGALAGHEIAIGGRAIRRPAASAMLLIPLLALIEPAHIGAHQLHVVNSSIEINASPTAIWPHLIEFQPIAPPQEFMFRAGIAYPTWSHTDGAGVGSTRYCEFSTGSVVERISAWDPGKRLAFNVESQPAPMVELTPYKNVEPRHLHGYVRSKQGEFRLVALADGRTRLEGTSSYELDIEPEAYWSLWVNSSVHAIHMRVFEHIKHEVESQASHANAAP